MAREVVGRPPQAHCWKRTDQGYISIKRKWVSKLIHGHGSCLSAGAAGSTDSHPEALLPAECCHVPVRRSQVLATPRPHPPVTISLSVSEIIDTDDFRRACMCAALPNHTRPACGSPSTLLTARCARLITG